MQHQYYGLSWLNAPYHTPVPMNGLGMAIDMSNLNAKYDAAFPPIAGLGAGIIRGTRMGSLSGPLGADPSYPWHTYSADTLALQQTTNKALKAQGYCPIGEDGKLGKDTCGAIRKMLEITGQTDISPPSSCSDFAEPSKPPCGGSVPGGGTTPGSQYVVTTGGGMGDTKWLIIGGVVAVGAVGLALYMKKRG